MASRYVQFLTFAVIGVANTLIHGFILVLLVELLGAAVVLSHLVAFMVANIFSYLMNSYFTFKTVLSIDGYVRFFLASLLALGLTLTLSWIMEELGLNYMAGFLVIVAVVPLCSFMLMKLWAFQQKSPRVANEH